jgi:hypothetical protein
LRIVSANLDHLEQNFKLLIHFMIVLKLNVVWLHFNDVFRSNLNVFSLWYWIVGGAWCYIKWRISWRNRPLAIYTFFNCCNNPKKGILQVVYCWVCMIVGRKRIFWKFRREILHFRYSTGAKNKLKFTGLLFKFNLDLILQT